MTRRRFKTQLESLARKLLPANTVPRRTACQLRRIKDRPVDHRSHNESYHFYEEPNPPETPRTRKDKLKIIIWILVALLSFGFMFYFFSQTSISCPQYGCP